MKKVLGIIALAACVACAEKPKAVTHPEVFDIDIWGCIDQLEDNYIMYNESGEAFPDITRYAWADIDGDGLAELFLASAEDVFPEISAVFALGDGAVPVCVGYQDASHEMHFYPEGVATLGTALIRYNYMDKRDRLEDSKLVWELCVEETKEVYLESEGDCGDIVLSRPGAEVEYPEEEDAEALLAEFTTPFEIDPEWEPLDGLYEMAEFQAGGTTINYNACRYSVVESQELGDDFTMKLQNRDDPNEWIGFTGYYDDGVDVLMENGNTALLAERLKGTCEENSLNVVEDEDYEIYDSYITSLDYFQPENGYYFSYEGDHKGESVYGAVAVRPLKNGNVLVIRAETTSYRTFGRFLEQIPTLTFDR